MVLSRSDETDLLIPIYEGVHETPPWRRFLSRLQHRTRADHAALVLRQGAAPMHEATQFFSGADIRARVLGASPTERALTDAVPFDRLKPGRVYSESELIELGDVDQHGQHRDYLAQIRVGSLRVVRIVAPEALWAWLVIARESGEFSAADGALLSAIVPNFAVALDIFAALERARFKAAQSEDALARAGIGWIALDAKGQRIEASALGERLAHSPGAPCRGRIETGRDEAERIVKAFSGARPLLAAALPATIAYVRDAPIGDAPRVAALQQLYGLSPKEAGLAVALANGQTLGEAAEALGLSLETARNYSKRIFVKTDTRGQADLVRLVLTGAASLA